MTPAHITTTIPPTPAFSYTVHVGESLFDEAFTFIRDTFPKRRIAVVSDENVWRAHGTRFTERANAKGLSFEAYILSPGEEAKRLETIGAIAEHFLEKTYNRDTLFVAFGGGVTGDMTGFVASVFTRGVPFVQMPTTIVSHVDSSIGGKTGVDTASGKNLLGTFSQPAAVFVSLDTLATLAKDEYIFGFAEVVKHALIADAALFTTLAENTERILARDTAFLGEVILRNIAIKKEVVEDDEKERGRRQILNFGHTIGHSIERAARFTMTHGEAVGLGIIYEARLSRAKGYITDEELSAITALLKALTIVRRPSLSYDADDLIAYTKNDKKAKGGDAKYVLLDGIGNIATDGVSYSHDIAEADVRAALAQPL